MADATRDPHRLFRGRSQPRARAHRLHADQERRRQRRPRGVEQGTIGSDGAHHLGNLRQAGQHLGQRIALASQLGVSDRDVTSQPIGVRWGARKVDSEPVNRSREGKLPRGRGRGVMTRRFFC